MRDDGGRHSSRNIKYDGGIPYTILVSTGRRLTPERYLELREAGRPPVLGETPGFPATGRHDDFRVYPGLYDHLSDVVPAALVTA